MSASPRGWLSSASTASRAYLVDRLVERAWSLAQVVDDLDAAPTTVWRLLDQHGVQRVGPTLRQRAVPGRGLGPQAQAHVAQQRRQARLAELGFAGIDEYLRDRFVGRGWSVRRLCAELEVGHGWLDRQLVWLGLCI
jgi:hypothetical protein